MVLDEVEGEAFRMISYAGDALNCYYSAIVKKGRDGDVEAARKLLDEGDGHLSNCHSIQTHLISAEANGEVIPYSLMMTHAQDHFITALNWQRMARLEIIDLA